MTFAGLLPRLLRVQFTPVMIAPVILGASMAWRMGYSLNPFIFLLALIGSVSLHLAANGIDDVYDYLNGTDQVAERMFPPDSPGWKPVARGAITVRQGFAVSYALYGLSLVVGLVLSVVVGWYALLIAVPGILLSYFYTAPPLKLDYRGFGLGELSILVSFGPIPALGAYYVLTGSLTPLPFLLAIPSGMLTMAVLMSHDLIFYDVYKEADKKTLAVVLGKGRTAAFSSAASIAAYLFVASFVVSGYAPVTCLAIVAALPLLAKLVDFGSRERTPPEYGKRTMVVFAHSVLFTLLLAAGFFLGGIV